MERKSGIGTREDVIMLTTKCQQAFRKISTKGNECPRQTTFLKEKKLGYRRCKEPYLDEIIFSEILGHK